MILNDASVLFLLNAFLADLTSRNNFWQSLSYQFLFICLGFFFFALNVFRNKDNIPADTITSVTPSINFCTFTLLVSTISSNVSIFSLTSADRQASSYLVLDVLDQENTSGTLRECISVSTLVRKITENL